ncbi:MAG: glycosyltransferase [Patescibacteria group bacterium]
MKIVFLASGTVRSNFSYRIVALARSLVRLGHEVSIIAPKADKYNNFLPENIAVLDGVKILQPFQFATKHPEINLLPYIFGAVQMLFRQKPELVYIYKPTPVSIVGLMGKFMKNTMVVTDFDDIGSKVMRIEGYPLHQRILVSWSEKLAARAADRLVVASTYLLKKYKSEYPKKPIHLMPNGVEADWFTHSIQSGAAKRIVFLGAINRKSILEPLFDVLPDLIKKHSDVEVLIIGDGEYLSFFKEKASELHIEKQVVFKGWMPVEKAKEYLQSGDIGYCYMPQDASTAAASNMKVPQYMSQGVVPLVSRVGDLPNIAEEGRVGYIAEPDNKKSLLEILEHALTDLRRKDKAYAAQESAKLKLCTDVLAVHFNEWIASNI